MTDLQWRQARTRFTAGLGVLAMVFCSVAPSALGQDEGAARIDQLRALAQAARENAASAQERTRQQLGSLNQRLEQTAAQNELLMEIMGQLMATQAGADIGARVEADLGQVEEQAAKVADAATALAADAQTEAEKALANATQAFEEVLSKVPTTQEELAAWSKEEIERIKAEVDKVKAAADKALDDYVENDLIPQIKESCTKATAYEQRLLVTQARNGGSISDTLQQIGCDEADDLVRKLSQARTAEEAQAAFQSSMQSMMMAAMMSGNPYVAAIAAVLMLLASLFADGNGDGDGDGVDDQPGGGPVEGAPMPGTSTAATDTPSNNPSPNPENDEDVVEEPDTPATEEIDPRAREVIRAAGGDPSIQAHPGVGCRYGILFGMPDSTITLTDPDDEDLSVDIDLTNVQGRRAFEAFPSSWKDERIRLISCDFTENAKGAIVQFTEDPAQADQCLRIRFEPNGDGGGVFRLTDTGFVIGDNVLCAGE